MLKNKVKTIRLIVSILLCLMILYGYANNINNQGLIMNNGAVYWVGADNNVWVKDSRGTQNVGQYLGGDANSYQAASPTGQGTMRLGNATLIADPNPPQSVGSAPAAGGGGGASAPVFNSAGAASTQRAIDQLPALLNAALAAEGTRYSNTVGGFNAAEGTQRKSYEDNTVTNQQNYDSNFMDSIRAGIHGLGGLMALLRGTGAGGGTAEDLARDTVGGVTANDIRTGADTQKENQGALDSSLSSFLTDLQQKRKAAEDTRVNNERAIRRDNATQLQDLFGKMAGFYGDVGNTAAANDWTNRAGALIPDIAANSATQVSPYDSSPVVVHAPNLTAFAPPTQPSVTTAPNGQVGSGIFTISDPRRRKETTPASVGA